MSERSRASSRRGRDPRNEYSSHQESIHHSVDPEEDQDTVLMSQVSNASNTSRKRKLLESHVAQKKYGIKIRLMEEKANLELEMIDQQFAQDLADVEQEEEDLRSELTRRAI